MARTNFRQADAERFIRAAKAEGGTVQMDLRTLVLTFVPTPADVKKLDDRFKKTRILSAGNLAPDGKDNFDED